MLSNYVVFCENAPSFKIKDGMVHIEDRSGKIVFERVMSITTFRNSIAYASELMALWDYEQLDGTERGNRPIPFRAKRK